MKKKGIKLNTLVYMMLFLSIYEIPYLTHNYNSINDLYNIFQVISICIIFAVAIKKSSISKIMTYIIMYFLIYIVSTILNNGEVYKVIFDTIKIVALCTLIEYGIRKNCGDFLNSYELFLFALVFLNFLTVLMYPNGMYISTNLQYSSRYNWLLGYKNIHILYILQFVFVSVINSIYKNNKICKKNIIEFVLLSISILLVKSSTSLVGLLLIFLLMIINKKINIKDKINIYHYSIAYIPIYISVVFLRIQDKYAELLRKLFNKSTTFTGRTYIWDYVWNFIRQKKILGYGLENSNYRIAKTTYLQSYHAHNQILEIIYKTGFIGLTIFFIIYLCCVKKIYKYRKEKVAIFISIFIFSYLIIMLTEAYNYIFFIPLFIFGYNIEYLIKEGDKNEN